MLEEEAQDDLASARKTPAPAANEDAPNPPTASMEKKSAYYQDTAMIRYRVNDEVKVVKDNEFINEFTIRPNDHYWKTIEVV